MFSIFSGTVSSYSQSKIRLKAKSESEDSASDEDGTNIVIGIYQTLDLGYIREPTLIPREYPELSEMKVWDLKDPLRIYEKSHEDQDLFNPFRVVTPISFVAADEEDDLSTTIYTQDSDQLASPPHAPPHM